MQFIGCSHIYMYVHAHKLGTFACIFPASFSRHSFMNIVVIEPSLDDAFDKFYLTPPTVVSGGSYFTRILYNVNHRPTPVYLHVPVCTSQKGYVKSGRRSYMDLMLSNTETVFVQWIENMEMRCRALLHEKNDVWFENKLEKDDIENAFNTCMKLYRSGKNIVMRVSVPPATTAVFNESGDAWSIESVDASVSFTSILEIRGIKFSENAFQMELELKQLMQVPSNPFSSKCFLKESALASASTSTSSAVASPASAPTSASTSAVGAIPVENEWIASAAAFLKSATGTEKTKIETETCTPQHVENEDVPEQVDENEDYGFRIEKNEVDIGDLLDTTEDVDEGERKGDKDDDEVVVLQMEEMEEGGESGEGKGWNRNSAPHAHPEWKRYLEMKTATDEACRLVEEAKKNANDLLSRLATMMQTHQICDPSPLPYSISMFEK